MLIFGGSDSSGAKLGDVWSLDLGNFSWSPVNAAGAPPPPRCHHAAIAVGDFVVVYGGRGGSNAANDSSLLGDVYVLDTQFKVWSRPRVAGRQPPARAWHAACSVSVGVGARGEGVRLGPREEEEREQEQAMVVFGGGGARGPLDDVVVLETRLLSAFASPRSRSK